MLHADAFMFLQTQLPTPSSEYPTSADVRLHLTLPSAHSVYVKPGPLSSRLTDLTKDQVAKLADNKRIRMCLLHQPKRGAAKKAKAVTPASKGKGKAAAQPTTKKRKSRLDSSGEDEDDGVNYNDSDVDDPMEDDEEEDTTAADEALALALQAKWAAEDAGEDDDEDDEVVPQARRSRASAAQSSRVKSDDEEDDDDDDWEVFGGSGSRLGGNVSIGDASAPIEID